VLFSVSALAALMLAASIAAAFVTQPAAAQDTSIPTTTHQTQTCDTAGSTSPISISCNGTSNNNVANSPSHPNPPSAEIKCPTDYTLSEGLRTGQPICPSDAQLNSQGQCTTTTIFVDIRGCPAGSISIRNGANGFICEVTTITSATCPGGITPTNGQCITKPGP
jgi:hypothetical protein